MLGFVFSLPYVVLFYVVWLVHSLLKPLLAVTLVCVLSNPAAAWSKVQLFINTVTYLALCNDKSWKKPQADPASFFPENDNNSSNSTSNDNNVQSKTIIFVRHGESTWNDTFNKGDRGTAQFLKNFIPNLVSAAATEWYFWVSGQANESWFYDAPLSNKGREQAEGVYNFLQSDLQYMTPKEASFLRLLTGHDKNGKLSVAGSPPAAQLVVSNLRRAISTMAIGFGDRLNLKLPNDKILILPDLQEISRNPDALSITAPHGKVLAAYTDPVSIHGILEHQVDTSKHTGNKPVDTNGLKRMQSFCQCVFEDIEKDAVVAAGHSLWFRSFFRTYLPATTEHIAKKKKIVNGGTVGFTLKRITVDGTNHYMIDPTSITVLHGGF